MYVEIRFVANCFQILKYILVHFISKLKHVSKKFK